MITILIENICFWNEKMCSISESFIIESWKEPIKIYPIHEPNWVLSFKSLLKCQQEAIIEERYSYYGNVHSVSEDSACDLQLEFSTISDARVAVHVSICVMYKVQLLVLILLRKVIPNLLYRK